MRLPFKLRALQSKSGNAAVEFVIVAPLLVLLLGGIVELGLAIRANFALQEALLSGANQASHKGWNATAIQTAITSSSPLVSAATVTVTRSCGCPVGTTLSTVSCDTDPLNPGTCPSSCSTTICTSDQLAARQYATITASIPRQSVFKTNFGLPARISATMQTRLRQ